MCRAMSEGGQRCASHTRERLAKRSEVLRQAVESGDPDTLATARSAWEDAAAEYASTTEGKASMDATRALARESGDLHTEALMTSLLQRGEAIKAANREAGALLAAARLAGAAPTGQPTQSVQADAGSGDGVRTSLAAPTKSVGLTRALSALTEDRENLEPQVRAFRVGWDTTTTVTMADLMQHFDERVATVTDPEATASEVRSAAKRAEPYLLAQHHQWVDTPYSEERQRSLMSFQNSLAEAEAEVLKMALDHPSADDDLAATIVNTGSPPRPRSTGPAASAWWSSTPPLATSGWAGYCPWTRRRSLCGRRSGSGSRALLSLGWRSMPRCGTPTRCIARRHSTRSSACR